eukprot:scaffold625_cov324-Pavlova_lutheri.AAC.86
MWKGVLRLGRTPLDGSRRKLARTARVSMTSTVEDKRSRYGSSTGMLLSDGGTVGFVQDRKVNPV